MEVDQLPGLWLQTHGCYNGTVRVGVEHPERHIMLLGHGWKIFARTHNLLDGHVLRFKMVEANLLSVKIYGCSGARLSCCEESSSGVESPSSSDSDEEDSDCEGGGDRSKLQAVRSLYDDVGSD
ncbi:l-ascorbate oxidase-like protein [Hordeum vulgare]|nr:l-ascorbate oxidase-like protein [Hordeum vulgare]